MITITIDESRASAEEVAALRAMEGYGALKAAIEQGGRQRGISLMSISRCGELASLKPQDVKRPSAAEEEVEHDMQAGTWVARRDNHDMPMLGRVKDSYTSGRELLLDIVVYQKDGTKVGRVSPAAGGPRGFEPACGAENWEPIAEPDFTFLADKGFWGRHLKRTRAERQEG